MYTLGYHNNVYPGYIRLSDIVKHQQCIPLYIIKMCIQCVSRVHKVLQKVLAAENWFSDIPEFFVSLLFLKDNIKIFKDVLFTNFDYKVINLNGNQIEIRDLTDICCDWWLNDSVISNLFHLTNNDISVTKCFLI